MQDFYPINLNLTDKSVLLIADDSIADSKLQELELAGAKVMQIQPTEYKPSHLKGVWLVLTAGDKEFNARVSADAEKNQIWVNAVDDPENCSAILPARFRQGSLLVTVSTSGTSPAFSSWLKNQLQDFVGDHHPALLTAVAQVREEIQKSGQSTESFNWQSTLDLAVNQGVLKLVQEGQTESAKDLIKKCLSLS